MAKTKYDQMIDLYRGRDLPRSLVLGLIKAESNFKETHVNRAPDAPGGGPKVGLMQPSKIALKEALDVDTVQESMLKNPVDNIRIGTTILNEFLKRLRVDFPAAFDRPLEADANAAALLVHAYTLGYAYTANLLRSSKTTSYRALANAYPTERGIAHKWPERVLSAARDYGYTQILAGGAAVAPALPPGPGPGPGPTPRRDQPGSALPWILGAAAVGGLLFFATQKKRRRA